MPVSCFGISTPQPMNRTRTWHQNLASATFPRYYRHAARPATQERREHVSPAPPKRLSSATKASLLGHQNVSIGPLKRPAPSKRTQAPPERPPPSCRRKVSSGSEAATRERSRSSQTGNRADLSQSAGTANRQSAAPWAAACRCSTSPPPAEQRFVQQTAVPRGTARTREQRPASVPRHHLTDDPANPRRHCRRRPGTGRTPDPIKGQSHLHTIIQLSGGSGGGRREARGTLSGDRAGAAGVGH